MFSAVLFGGDEQNVLAAQQRWIDSYNRRDEKALSSAETNDFRITFGDGSVQTKQDQLERLRRLLPPGSTYELVVEVSEVRLHGKTAVITGIVAERGSIRDDQGGIRQFNQRSRYTDTWVLDHRNWHVMASHLTELKP
jgi:hypothetical protein